MVKKEITIMKELKHKNIVQYKEDFRDKGEWYIILEYCGKGDMEQFKKKVGTFEER
jgi:serine/threonine protein kinase